MADNLRWSDLASFAFKVGENANEGVSKLAEKSDIFENFENFDFFQFFIKFLEEWTNRRDLENTFYYHYSPRESGFGTFEIVKWKFEIKTWAEHRAPPRGGRSAQGRAL